jgi:hypothetical protein
VVKIKGEGETRAVDYDIMCLRLSGMAEKGREIPAPFKFQLTVLRKPLVVVGW